MRTEHCAPRLTIAALATTLAPLSAIPLAGAYRAFPLGVRNETERDENQSTTRSQHPRYRRFEPSSCESGRNRANRHLTGIRCDGCTSRANPKPRIVNPSFSGERYGIGFWALSLGRADREKAESGIGRGVVLEIRKSMPKLDRARAPRASLVVVCWAALEWSSNAAEVGPVSTSFALREQERFVQSRIP